MQKHLDQYRIVFYSCLQKGPHNPAKTCKCKTKEDMPTLPAKLLWLTV